MSSEERLAERDDSGEEPSKSVPEEKPSREVEGVRPAWSERFSLERWLRRNLRSKSAIRKLVAGATKGLVEVFVSLLLTRATVWFVTVLFGPVPANLFVALPGNLTLAGVFFFVFYFGGIKDTLGPN